MEWDRTQKTSDGFCQLSTSPKGYCITFHVAKDGTGVFTASDPKTVVIGYCYVDPNNREMLREMGRAMRAMCGLYDSIPKIKRRK